MACGSGQTLIGSRKRAAGDRRIDQNPQPGMATVHQQAAHQAVDVDARALDGLNDVAAMEHHEAVMPSRRLLTSDTPRIWAMDRIDTPVGPTASLA
jgi:hypothetical protein